MVSAAWTATQTRAGRANPQGPGKDLHADRAPRSHLNDSERLAHFGQCIGCFQQLLALVRRTDDRPQTRFPFGHRGIADRWREHPRIEQLARSEEHTSELQSRENLVCRLLLEK